MIHQILNTKGQYQIESLNGALGCAGIPPVAMGTVVCHKMTAQHDRSMEF